MRSAAPSPPPAASPPPDPTIQPSSYSHSPIHHAVALADLRLLSRLLSALPLPSHAISPIDRRDGIPSGDTPLHLAVRLNLPSAASLLLSAGADPSLQNSLGWTPLHISLSLRRRRISSLLLRHHRISSRSKFRHRAPLLVAPMCALPDFYVELSYCFTSSIIPFLSRAAPSDTYRIWKREADVRVDATVDGFDGLRVRRADRSFLFLASSHLGSLLVLDRRKREVYDALEGVDSSDYGAWMGVGDDSAYRPGLDITKAELVARRNWLGKEKVEMVGEWKARVYDVHNVIFTIKTMRAAKEEEEVERKNVVLPLELSEDADKGFLVAEIPQMPGSRSAAAKEDGQRRSVDVAAGRGVVGKSKEKEMSKNLKPTVWLTEDFPLKTEDFLPLLDILANKVKALRRLRELLTKFPPGTFPVKISIPVVPTVRLVYNFSKFVYLQPSDQFFTPLSSPRHLSLPEEEQHLKAETENCKTSWLKLNNNSTPKTSATRSKFMGTSQVIDDGDPFTIPSDYTWVKSKS